MAGRSRSTRSHTEFFYNPANHTLYWDEDGAGGSASVAIARFLDSDAPTASDFLVADVIG